MWGKLLSTCLHEHGLPIVSPNFESRRKQRGRHHLVQVACLAQLGAKRYKPGLLTLCMEARQEVPGNARDLFTFHVAIPSTFLVHELADDNCRALSSPNVVQSKAHFLEFAWGLELRQVGRSAGLKVSLVLHASSALYVPRSTFHIPQVLARHCLSHGQPRSSSQRSRGVS